MKKIVRRLFKELKHQGGFTIIEVIVVLAIAAVIISTVLGVRARGTAASWVQSKNNQFASVMSSMDLTKASHNMTYPAAANPGSITSGATTTATNAVAAYVGSTSTDINQWKYQCASGGSSMIIQIIDTATPSTDAQQQLVDKINTGYGSLVTAVASANTVTVTTTGTPCQ